MGYHSIQGICFVRREREDPCVFSAGEFSRFPGGGVAGRSGKRVDGSVRPGPFTDVAADASARSYWRSSPSGSRPGRRRSTKDSGSLRTGAPERAKRAIMSLQNPMSLNTGARLGPYEIVGVLGAGGMGEVYRARDSRLGRDVAIKVLPGEFSSDRERVARFELEARSASALDHPNIISIYD